MKVKFLFITLIMYFGIFGVLGMAEEKVQYGYCDAPLNIRAMPTIDSDWVAQFPTNSTIRLLEEVGEWYRIENGYIKKEFVKDSISCWQEGICKEEVLVRCEPDSKAKVTGVLKKGDKILAVGKTKGYVVLEKCGYVLEEEIDFSYSLKSRLSLEDLTQEQMINTRIGYLAMLPKRTLGYGYTTKKSLYFVGEIPIYDVIDGYAYFPSGRDIYKIAIENFQEIKPVGEEHEIISAYRTSYHSSGNSRKTNIELVSTYLNQVIKPNETFSFNQATGKRSKQKGYQIAPVQANGEIAEDYGGGVCQVSSTIYATVMQTEKILIQKRRKHGQEVFYLPFGMDATVNYGSIDFQFQNGYDIPVKLEVEAQNGAVLVVLRKSV